MALQLLVSGLALGSIYALLALSLVLIHKATDVVNFGQGEMSMFSVFIAFFMLDVLGLPLIVVFLLGFPLGALLGAGVEYLFIHPLQGDPPVNLLIRRHRSLHRFQQPGGLDLGFRSLQVSVAVSDGNRRYRWCARFSEFPRRDRDFDRDHGSPVSVFRAYARRHRDARRHR